MIKLMNGSRIDLSLVIACYRDAPHLRRNVEIIKRTLDATIYRVEWIFVEDAGRDGSEEILDGIRRDLIPEAHIILHPENRGRGATVRSGFAIACGEILGFIDIDLAVSPVYILQMIDAIRRGRADGAVAWRIYRTSFHPHSIMRDTLSCGYRLFSRLYLGHPFPDTEAGYKFFRHDAYAAICDQCSDPGWFWDTELMGNAHAEGLKILSIPCLYRRDRDKASTVHVLKDTLDYLANLRRFKRKLKKAAPLSGRRNPA
jgi:glycosyltransferase involved in cell wall biosynthesis